MLGIMIEITDKNIELFINRYDDELNFVPKKEPLIDLTAMLKALHASINKLGGFDDSDRAYYISQLPYCLEPKDPSKPIASFDEIMTAFTNFTNPIITTESFLKNSNSRLLDAGIFAGGRTNNVDTINALQAVKKLLDQLPDIMNVENGIERIEVLIAAKTAPPNLPANNPTLLEEVRDLMLDFAKQTGNVALVEAMDARIFAANRTLSAEPEIAATHTPALVQQR